MRATFARAEVSAGMLDVLHLVDLHERFAPHMHEAYAFGVFERGSYRLRIGGVEHVTAPGDVVALSPGEIHSGAPVSDESWCTRMFYPDAAVTGGLLGVRTQGEWNMMFTQSLIRDRALSRDLVRAHDALMNGQGLAGEEQFVCTLATLVKRFGESAARRAMSRPVQFARLTAVREYIHDNLTSPIRLTTLAALAGVSPYHLIRLFGRELGVSPYAYVKQLRVVHAQRLLRDGCSATEAAFAAGFSDQSHLNRAFKNMLGVTPGVFARAIGAAEQRRVG